MRRHVAQLICCLRESSRTALAAAPRGRTRRRLPGGALLLAALAAPLGLPLAPALAEAEAARPRLERERTIAESLGPDRALRYDLAVRKGEYVKVEALQKGVDLVLRVFDPAGKLVGEVDSPNGSVGPEPLGFEAAVEGIHQVEVACLDKESPPGRFELRVALALDPASYARYRLVEVGTDDLARVTGSYEIAPDHHVMVGFLGGINVGRDKPVLVTVDMKTRVTALLHPTSPTRWFLGPALTEPYPPVADYEFTLTPDGKAATLQITPAGAGAGAGAVAGAVAGRASASSAALTGRRAPLRMERVTFTNGDVTLKGWLTLPAGPGPFPAMVMAHGSQASTGEPFFLGAFLARKGVAFLSFDKRGAGESSGDWKQATLPELASDVLAGVAYVRGRPEIAPARVGVWGVSQGGWVGSIAAAQSKDVAFLVAQVGSGVSVAENMVHEARSVMRKTGMPEAEQEQASALLRQAYGMMSDGSTQEQVRAAIGPALKPSWAPFFALPLSPPANYFWRVGSPGTELEFAL